VAAMTEAGIGGPASAGGIAVECAVSALLRCAGTRCPAAQDHCREFVCPAQRVNRLVTPVDTLLTAF
jgi:hypothetical protein